MNRNIATKVTDMVTDWARKDADAQKEAVTRLGLPENNTASDRATAMGFGDDMYHGTKADFDSFNGRGTANSTYVTPSTRIANLFSNIASQDGGSRVLPLRTRGKIFDYDDPEQVAKLEQEIGLHRSHTYNLKQGIWRDLEAKPVQEAIKKQGYDGFNVKETYNTPKNTGIYNPANIRSKFAHFNPKYAGVGAGSVMSADLMADELDLEYKGQEPSTWDSLMNTIGGVNQKQAQAYGDTGAGTMGGTAGLAGMLATDPAVIAEVIGTVGLKSIGAVSPYIRGFGLGLLLDAKEMGNGEIPNFKERLFAGEFGSGTPIPATESSKYSDEDFIKKLEGR
jgi:hypothetical protein